MDTKSPKRRIPNWIVREDVRIYLAELAHHLDVLEQAHAEFMPRLKEKALTPDESEMLRDIIRAHSNLSSQWNQLAPNLVDALMDMHKPK